ncbi:MAG TPA: hypothetical protein EYQ14_26105 [Gammaproteobacteria bacterium]|nr:hypothetical protein [Gammaproteobacteria bacterium]HIL95834.1 hypothetical protein [Pseudomonadales bacterium]
MFVRFSFVFVIVNVVANLMLSPPVAASSLRDSQSLICDQAFVPADGNYDFLATDNNLPSLTPRIRNIHITRLPIFNEQDPKENNWLFRFANRFHVLTTQTNIEQQLLFTTGDVYDPRIMEESARLLRQLSHLYDAGIRTVSVCEDEVELEVVTRDVWSLNLDISYGRSGGENKHRFGISESNLLGTGRRISIASKKDSERESTEIGYKDVNLFGTRIRGDIRYANADDGADKLVSVNLPFFALDSKRAWGVRLQDNKRIDKQYFRGHSVTEVDHKIEDFSTHYGFSAGIRNGLTKRWRLGYRFRKDVFTPSDDLPPPTEKPRNTKLSYPFLQYEVVEDNYTTSSNLNEIQRTEDLHLGYFFHASFGYAAKGFGSDVDRFVFSGQFRDTLIYNNKILLQHSLNGRGLWNKDKETSEDVVLSYDIKYFRSQTEKRSFFAQLSTVLTRNLNSNQQVLLGGSTGARGFNNRYQDGDRRVVLTLEERQYTEYHLFNLAYLGFAGFIDIGRAWNPDVDDGLEDKLLADVGFGLRLASTKADSNRIIHIDIAFPITNRNQPDVDGYQLVVRIKDSL